MGAADYVIHTDPFNDDLPRQRVPVNEAVKRMLEEEVNQFDFAVADIVMAMESIAASYGWNSPQILGLVNKMFRNSGDLRLEYRDGELRLSIPLDPHCRAEFRPIATEDVPGEPKGGA